jgi:hypothetical protein
MALGSNTTMARQTWQIPIEHHHRTCFFHITPAISINGFSAEQYAGNRVAHKPMTVV